MAEVELTYVQAATHLGRSVDWVRKQVREGRIRSNGVKHSGARVIMDIEGSAVVSAGMPAWTAASLFHSLAQIAQEVAEIDTAIAEARQHQTAVTEALDRADAARQRLRGMVEMPVPERTAA